MGLGLAIIIKYKLIVTIKCNSLGCLVVRVNVLGLNQRVIGGKARNVSRLVSQLFRDVVRVYDQKLLRYTILMKVQAI